MKWNLEQFLCYCGAALRQPQLAASIAATVKKGAIWVLLYYPSSWVCLHHDMQGMDNILVCAYTEETYHTHVFNVRRNTMQMFFFTSRQY